ncbi:MAG: chemotaxis protein CheD [Planctomycetes bacterium]|nr:chemotaxis protein CheD [Planctomycetota bacterium]
MRNIINVQIGEIQAARGNAVLETSGIGSCIAIAAYDPPHKAGALAHIMLPGRCPQKNVSQKHRYAEDAIDGIMEIMSDFGAKHNTLVIALAGGANVLQKTEDTISTNNINSALNYLAEQGLTVTAHSLGGNDRRSLSLNLEQGIILYSHGDRRRLLLWQAT